MVRKTLTKKIPALFLAAVMLCTVAVFAVTYESGHIDIVAGNKTYDVSSILYQDSSTQYRASVWAQTTDSSNVPANYIGVDAYLCNEAQELIYNTGWKYNSTTANFHYAVTPKQRTSDIVYATGQVKLYTGTKHVIEAAPETTYVGGSRSMSVLTRGLVAGAYPTNSAGKTYGSVLCAQLVGHQPDLISAVGRNGISGYVKNEDLNPEIRSEADIAAYNAALANDRSIPLYDLQGNVIGAFEIGVSEDVAPGATDIETVKAVLEADMSGRETIQEAKARVAGAAAGFVADAATISPKAERATAIQNALIDGKYPTTIDGKSYGPISLYSIVGEYPDLVSVVATNGEHGYVKFEEFDPFSAFCSKEGVTDEEINEYIAENLSAEVEIAIPVYDAAGTVIGSYLMGCSES